MTDSPIILTDSLTDSTDVKPVVLKPVVLKPVVQTTRYGSPLQQRVHIRQGGKDAAGRVFDGGSRQSYIVDKHGAFRCVTVMSKTEIGIDVRLQLPMTRSEKKAAKRLRMKAIRTGSRPV